VARTGCSEHQTGLVLEVAQVGRGMALDDDHVDWLAENCWEHGFIVRYPEGREDTTGIPAEPWHLRYVGRDASMEMRERGWVLEEWHEAHSETTVPGTGVSSVYGSEGIMPPQLSK